VLEMNFALQFENAMPDRKVQLIALFIIFLASSFAKFTIKKNNLLIGLLVIDTIAVFSMEILSRYVVNYALHILFLLIILEAAIILNLKNFKVIGSLIGVISLLIRNFSTIAESITVTLFTFITIISLYLVKIIQKQKEEAELLYEELKLAHQDLAQKYEELNLEFEYDPKVKDLTDRELEIAKLIAKGLSNSEIGEKLYISEGTVKNHITNIFKKLDMRDRTQLAIFVVKNRLE
jgi:DNA-binding CsgD family transcriptional regulator